MFVVRYDADKQTHLVNHTDDASISINILLDDGFEGGGTRFWNKITGKPFAHVQPTQVGQVLMHGALMNHEGVHVTKGRRTILVAFLEVDRTDPFQKPPTMTGLSWYASWGSLDWLEVCGTFFVSLYKCLVGFCPKAKDRAFVVVVVVVVVRIV